MSAAENGAEVVDATVVEDVPTVPDLGALVPTGGTELAVTPSVTADELVERLSVIEQAQQKAMKAEVDYGVIPGTGSKPTLLKPGAEKLSVLFQLDVQLVNEKRWEADHHLTVISRATAYHAPTGARLGYGEGICTTREKKYGKRTQDRTCPECGAETIKRSKYPPRNNPNADPGWYCFAKIGGCGANFDAGDEKIASQATGEIDNPDLPDTWNTVVKMAEKRARVDVVLAVTGASALFTQDVEDGQSSPDAETAEQSQRAPAPQQTAGPTPGPKIPGEKVIELRKAIAALKPTYRELGMALTAAGAPWVGGEDAEGVRRSLENLTLDQATKLGAEFERMAQDKRATQPQAGGAG